MSKLSEEIQGEIAKYYSQTCEGRFNAVHKRIGEEKSARNRSTLAVWVFIAVTLVGFLACAFTGGKKLGTIETNQKAMLKAINGNFKPHE